MRRFNRVMLLGSVAFSGAGLLATSPAFAQAGPPSVTLQTAPLVDPATARAAYGSAAVHTVGIAARPTAAPEIVALARSLGSEQRTSGQITDAQYIDNVLQWVRNNVEVEFRYGLSKGAVGALIDQYGSPFDQAELMVVLLRTGGITASYQLGDLTMSAQQFGHWSGLVRAITTTPAANSDPYYEFAAQGFSIDAQSACQLLADGGIPATVNGSASCTSLSGALTTVTVSHIWVTVGSQLYDPALKMHLLKPGIDLSAAMGCGTVSASTCGASPLAGGGTLGTQNGATTLTGPGGVQAAFGTYQGNLLSAVRASTPLASTVDIVGGKKIAPSVAAATFATTGATYNAAGPSISGDIPDQYRTTLAVTAPSIGTCTFFGDELAGQRLLIMGQTDSGLDFNVEGRSMLLGPTPHPCAGGGATVAAGHIQLTVNHPYTASSGAYADRTIDFPIVEPGGMPPFEVDGYADLFPGTPETSILGSYPMFVVHGFGEAAPSAEQYINDLNTAAPPNNTYNIPCRASTGENMTTESCSYANMPVLAEQIRVRATSFNKLVSGVSKAGFTQHDQIGLVYSSRNQSTKFMSVSASYSINNQSVADTNARLRAFELAAAGLPQLESMSMANIWDYRYPLFTQPSPGSPILMVPPSAMSAVLSAMPAPTTETAQNQAFEAQWRVRLQQAANAGYTVVMNDHWRLDGGEIFVRPNDLAYTFWAGVKGGQVSDPFKLAMTSIEVSREGKPRPHYSSVSLADGALSFSPPPDIVSGSGAFPVSLPLQRSYRGGATETVTGDSFQYYYGSATAHGSGSAAYRYTGLDQDASARFGAGWTHNYNVSATLSWDMARAIGDGSGVDALPVVSALVVMNDVAAQIISSPTVLNRYSLAVYKPFIFPIETALVKKGASSESFSLLWTGEFLAHNGSPARLQAATTYLSAWNATYNAMVTVGYPTSLTYTGAGGDIITFGSLARVTYEAGATCDVQNPPPPTPQYYAATPTYLADSWAWPSGMKVNFAYEDKDYWSSFGEIIDHCSTSKAKVLKTVSNNLGRSLTFNSTAYAPIAALWNDGRSNYGYNPPLGYLINSVQDETGRAVNFTRTNCPLGMLCDTLTVQDAASAITTYNYVASTASPNPTIIHRPSYQMHSWSAPTAPTVAAETIVYDELSRVKQVTNANNISNYYFGGGLLGSELYRPGRSRDSYGESLRLHDDAGNAVRSVNALGFFSRVVYDSANRPIRTVSPELNEQRKTYDIRSNVLEERAVAKPGTGLADLVTTNTYIGGPTQLPYQCTSAMLCNKAIATIDPRGFQTDFGWSATFGEMLTMTSPADSSGTRPLVTLGYSPFTGTAGSQFYLLTSKTENINGSQNATTTYGYATSNKFALKEVVVDSGGLNLRTCLQSDPRGHLISKTDPSGTSGSCP